MFRGNHPTRIDEKGRLKVPAEFKRHIDEKYGDKFYITSRDGRSAEVHPLEEWEKIEQKIAQMPSSSPAKKKLMNLVSYYGQVAEIDQQGRLLVPQILREKANLIGDVVVFGKLTFLDVMNREAFNQEIEANPLTDADGETLAAYGL
jgi:MraZ protein